MKAKDVVELLNSKKIRSMNIIDIRETYELKGGKVNGSKNIPMQKLKSNPQKFLNKDETYYIMCQSGMRSFWTSRGLRKMGYNVKNIRGGYLKWKTISM